MKIKIEKLYGIRNSIDFQFDKSCLIFAPNGVGKSCVAKGLKGFSEKNFKGGLEGTIDIDSILIDEKNYRELDKNVELINSTSLDEIINDKENIIINFLNIKSKRKSKYKNIYANFFKIYYECMQELNDNGITYNPLDEVADELQKISKIKEFLNAAVDRDSDPQDLKKEINNWREKSESLKILDNIPNLGSLEFISKKIGILKKKSYKPGITSDKEIIDLIIDKKREEKFFYLEEKNKQISIIEAEIKIKKLLKENGLSEDVLKGVQAYDEVNKSRGIKKHTKTTGTQKKYALMKIKESEEKLFQNVLIKHKPKFKKVEKQVEKIFYDFKKEMNEITKKVNSEILKSDKLKWKIQVKEIKTTSDFYNPLKIQIQDDNALRESPDLNDYASTGQKRIIALILSMISVEGNNLIVFDDPISSLDLDNVYTFLDVIFNFKNKFVILTHNYNLLAAASKTEIEKFYVMDSEHNNQVVITEINGDSALKLNKWLREKTSNGEEKVLILASVLREIIDNYLYNGYKKPKNNTIIERLYELKIFLDNNYRHFKTFKRTFKEAKDELNNIIGKELSEILICKEGSLSFLFEFESNKDIFEYVKKKEININFISFLDYVAQKYTLALKCRFLFEKKVINEHKTKEWNDGKIKGIEKHPNYKNFNKELKEINNQLNLLNHVNNLRWSPVIELPLHKIQMYWDKIEGYTKD